MYLRFFWCPSIIFGAHDVCFTIHLPKAVHVPAHFASKQTLPFSFAEQSWELLTFMAVLLELSEIVCSGPKCFGGGRGNNQIAWFIASWDLDLAKVVFGSGRYYSLIDYLFCFSGKKTQSWESLTLTTLTYFCINHGDQTFVLNLKLSKISYLALIASFEYLCYGSTAIINI